MTVLSANNLSVRLASRLVLSSVNLRVVDGEMVCLLGPNGAGKTTLLKALAGLLPGNRAVCLDSQPLHTLALPERARRIAYLPQGSIIHWPVRVRDLVTLGRLPHGKPGYRCLYDMDDGTNPDNLAVRAALRATGPKLLRSVLSRPYPVESARVCCWPALWQWRRQFCWLTNQLLILIPFTSSRCLRSCDGESRQEHL